MDYQRSRDNLAEDQEPIPMTNTEKVIEDAWKHVLRKENEITLGPEDDFFKLGGDSLRAIMLICAEEQESSHLSARNLYDKKLAWHGPVD